MLTDEQMAERLEMPLSWIQSHREEARKAIQRLDDEEAIQKFVEPLDEQLRQRALSLIKVTMDHNGGKLPNLNQILLRTQ